ncbi:hypothetical protein GCM10010116_23630 [Microbispora rosea subsp. aerata]|nr:hypothetical protein [Microbispora rosea]GGO11744.1 hypothetical protein GCM10010116_23630 [Microbispora rosea subsp. aerata]GIH55707.1 hypothetical protein Mro02_26210 [Microbispora rosea subsp. aerata]GLJ85994.1 hypothetical protein GCM10017588_47270 [Microbispora rosea subsp. aerata]
MSRFTDELRDPWALLLGATTVGAAWAAGVPAVAAPVAGVAVWLIKAFASAWQSAGGESRTAPQAPPVTKGSPEEGWLRRAERAAASFAELTASMRGQLLLDRIAAMGPQVDDTVETLRRLAGHASVTGRALARFDPGFLDQERTRLTQARRTAREEVAGELDRSIAALDAQREVYDRLSRARERVLARLQSGALSLESLVARAVEISAMTAASDGTGGGARAFDELTAELELTRQSLHEIEEATRQDIGP